MSTSLRRPSGRRGGLHAQPAVRAESIQIGDQLGHVLVTPGRIHVQTPLDHLDRIDRNSWIDRAQRWRAVLEPIDQRRQRIVRLHPRTAAGEQVVENQAKRIDVAPLIGGVAAGLLGRHVLERADNRSGKRIQRLGIDGARDAEVGQPRVILGIDDHVGGLEVAVDDAGLVDGGETVGNLARDRERASDRHLSLAFQQEAQVRSLHVLHRQVLQPVDLAEIVNADDVRMGDLTREPKLALEALLERLEVGLAEGDARPDDFQRDRAAERLVPRVVHLAHTAGAEQLDDGVARRELLTGLERGDSGGRRRVG